jgi:hypothetical protein
MHGTEPPCERCRPRIHENNSEAWNIYNIIGSSDNLLNSIIEVSHFMPVYDLAEIFLKVGELISFIRSHKEI